MKHLRSSAFICGFFWVCSPASAQNWPQFRGPQASGVADGATPPVAWTAPRWKTPIPGLGHSSPIVWGDRVFVATAVSSQGSAPLRLGLYGDGDSANDVAEQSWNLYCLTSAPAKSSGSAPPAAAPRAPSVTPRPPTRTPPWPPTAAGWSPSSDPKDCTATM